MKISSKPFGKLPDGRQVQLYTLTNDNHFSFEVINYGGIITSIMAPDKNGKAEDVIIGFDDLSGFLHDTSYINALIGRVGNRIGNSAFTLNGNLYKLAANEGNNHLHGGINAFHRVLWDSEPVETADETGIKLTYFSRHMEEGYPGNLVIEVKMLITNQNEIKILYKATTDESTHINLTHHGYFNLNGGKSNVLDHELKLYATHYTEVDSALIASGSILPVKGTDFDFTEPLKIGARIGRTGGYDLNYVIDKKPDEMAMAAEMFEPDSGRLMKVYTDQPGIQLYTATHFNGSVTGKKEKKHIQYYAFCFETQHFPNSPNIPHFPSTVLNPGDVYRQATTYKFEVR